MDEIINKKVTPSVKLKINFSQPRRCEPVSDKMLELLSLVPLACKNIKADKVIERII